MKPKAKGGLRFHDLHAFSIAILARQGWRIIQYPFSLCAQVLKTRYFLRSEALHAHQRDRISYTPSIPNCKTFDFFAPSLTTRLIQKMCANIVKFKSFLKNFY